MNEDLLACVKSLIDICMEHKEQGQGFNVKVSETSLQFTAIPQPVTGSTGSSGRKRRPRKKKMNLEQVQNMLLEFQDVLKVEAKTDYIKVTPTTFLDDKWGPINSKIKEEVGGYCWQKEGLDGKEKHWKIPKGD